MPKIPGRRADSAWTNPSSLTEKDDIRAALQWIVDKVRDGKLLNDDHMLFLVEGVERHLAGKKPWPAQRGAKKTEKTEALIKAYPIYKTFMAFKVGSQAPYDHAGALHATAEEHGVSDDTVRRAVKLVSDALETKAGYEAYRCRKWDSVPR